MSITPVNRLPRIESLVQILHWWLRNIQYRKKGIKKIATHCIKVFHESAFLQYSSPWHLPYSMWCKEILWPTVVCGTYPKWCQKVG